jgi:hypothetical protein
MRWMARLQPIGNRRRRLANLLASRAICALHGVSSGKSGPKGGQKQKNVKEKKPQTKQEQCVAMCHGPVVMYLGVKKVV